MRVVQTSTRGAFRIHRFEATLCFALRAKEAIDSVVLAEGLQVGTIDKWRIIYEYLGTGHPGVFYSTPLELLS
jgi:hypothetical protein